MEMQFNYHAFLLLVLFSVLKTVSGVEEDICGTINANVNPDTEFDFPDRFKAHVETVLPDEGRIVGASMRFAQDINMLKVDFEAPSYRKALYHDYENKQTLAYDFLAADRGSCTVDGSMSERWGFYLIPNPPASIQAKLSFKPSDILRLTGKSGFGDDTIALQKSNDNMKFRSLPVSEYTSCQKLKTADGSELVVKVTHLLSKTKLTRSESGTVPVQIVFDGKFKTGSNVGSSIKHTFNFFHYTTNFTNEEFESPLGIICPGRKGNKDFPKPPNHISFGQEIHPSNFKDKMMTLRTTYDFDLKYVTETTFNPEPTKMDGYRVDDFYSGLSFAIDPNTQQCQVMAISESFKVNDYVEYFGKIQMMNPQQFFDIEHIKYYYNGKKHFRGLETDSWIGKDIDTGYVYEWYFASGIKHSVNDYAKIAKNETYQILYKRILWLPDSSENYATYYFQVDFTKPSNRLNLSPCFGTDMKLVSIFVPGLEKDRIVKDENIVLQYAMKSLTEAMNIRFTRIAALNIEFRGDKGYFVFYLGGNFRHTSDVASTAKEPTLEEAYQTLKEKLDSNTLRFNTGNEDIYLESAGRIEDIQVSLSTDGSSGYSAGAMAGLAIAMTIIGLAGGGAGGYWFFIRRH